MVSLSVGRGEKLSTKAGAGLTAKGRAKYNNATDSKGTIFLESKKDMKSRGLASPDAADAIAVTFAFPVARREARVDNTRRVAYGGNAASSGWMAS